MGIDPISLTVGSLALSALSAGAGAVGAIQSASAQSDAAKYQAQVSANNAIIANQNAAYATQAGEQAATVEGLKSAASAGAVRTGIAGNGIDVNTGSAADVQAQQRQAGLLDTETVRQNAAMQNYGFRTQSTGFTAESQLQRARAAQATTAGDIGAAGSLLGGASSVASKWSNFQLLSGRTPGADNASLLS